MKLMFCAQCGDLVVPSRKKNEVRWCECGRHGVWWVNPVSGTLRMHDRLVPDRNGGDGALAWVIAIHNNVLTFPGSHVVHTGRVGDEPEPHTGNIVTRKEWVETMLHLTPDHYVFKKANSLVVRLAPGYTSDTGWAKLPEGNQK